MDLRAVCFVRAMLRSGGEEAVRCKGSEVLISWWPVDSTQSGLMMMPDSPSLNSDSKLDRSARANSLCRQSRSIKYLHNSHSPSQLSHSLHISRFSPCPFNLPSHFSAMAPKAGEKKPAPAKKAVAKKSTGGKRKGGSKKAVESYKIYIYKVMNAVTRFAFTAKVSTLLTCGHQGQVLTILLLCRCSSKFTQTLVSHPRPCPF